MQDVPEQGFAVRALAALDDPSRRRLYEFARGADRPVTREVAAEALGISRKLAAFHLDKLVDAGLLVAEFDAAARSRALGRTPKAYRPSGMQVRLSIPERRPEALAAVLLDAITSARPGESASEAALRLADEAGRRLGSQAREQRKPGRLGPERALGLAEEVLAEYGFEPLRSSTTCVRLRNCPYQPLTAHAADLVCGMNQRHVAGLLRGLQAPASVTAVLAPRPPQCCVELRA